MSTERESRPTMGAATRTDEVLYSISAPCPWCGQASCAERFNHEWLDATSETTWRHRAAELQR